MRRPACAIVVAVGLVSAVPRSAHAAQPALPLELTWNAPAQCPGASFVMHRVEQLVRGHQGAIPKVVASANIENAANGTLHLALTLRSEGVEETRTVEGPSCSALAEASAVVIALAIDPSSMDEPARIESVEPATEHETAAAPRVPDVPAPPPVAPPSTDAQKHAAPTRPGSPRFAAGLGAATALGTLPSIGTGLVASAGLRLGRFRAGVLGTVWSRQSPTFSANAGASFDLIEVGAFGAYMFPVGAIAIGPSAEVDATYMRVQGFGIRAPRGSSTLWPTAALGARLEAPFTRWLGLFSRGDVLFPIGAPTYTLGTSGQGVQLHEPSRVSLRLSIGIEIVLP